MQWEPLTIKGAARPVEGLGDVVAILRAAEPQKKAELHGELDLNVTYEPIGWRVLVEADLSRVRIVRVGGRPAQIASQTGAGPWRDEN